MYMKTSNVIRYDMLARLLHWTIAVLLIGLVSIGWYMMSIEDQPNSGAYFTLHKSFGLIAAVLILMRLLWRLAHKPAPLPSSVPRWQGMISRFNHFLLYICMIVMPVTGFIGASFSKYGVVFFGFELPAWVQPNHAISKKFFEIHSTVTWILVALVVFHVLAAIKHLVINKDGVFQRMAFTLKD